MQGIQFDEPQKVFIEKTNNTKVIGFLLKHKIFKNNEQARIYLIGFIILSVAISGYLFIYSLKTPETKYNLDPHIIKNLPFEAQKTIYESYK